MIHIAQKELGMDDETYRHMLWTIGRVRSAGDLDAPGRKAVLDHLKGCGFKVKGQRRVSPSSDRAPLINKVRALLGPTRTDNYALGILRKMYGQDAAPAKLEWASPDQLRKVIAALNYDRQRREREETDR